MKTIFSNVIFILFANFLISGQTQTLIIDYGKSFGGPKFDEAKNIYKDNNGYVYVVGSFNDTADLDPGIGQTKLYSFGGYDVFVSKFSASGELIWTRQIGGPGYEQAYVVSTDADNNIIILGSFTQKTDFNPGADTFYLTSRGDEDIFVAKLNENGDFIWAKQFGGSSKDLCRTMTLDPMGNIYVGGAFYGKAFFGTDTLSNFFTSLGIRDICLFKLNTTGDLQWVKRIGNNKDEACYGITLDADGNIYTTGYFGGTVDFDPNAGVHIVTASGVYNAFVAKFNNNCELLWVKRLGGTYDIYGRAIVLDDSLNIYTTGQFRETVDFDPGPNVYNLSVVGYFDIFVSKLNKNGDFVWAKNYGGVDNDGFIYGYDNGLSLALDTKQQSYVAATFWDTIVFTMNSGTFTLFPRKNGEREICLLKHDTAGNLTDVVHVGSKGYDIANRILIDKADNIFIAGHFTDSLYFNNNYLPQVAPIDSTDAFFLKFHYCENTFKTIDTIVCNQYISPGGKVFANSGIFYDTLINYRGCDSVLTINLTVHYNSNIFINHTACDSYQWFGNTLDTSGIYTHTLTNAAGCDSIITLNLTINHSTSNVINHAACNSYQWFGNTLDTSGIYTHTLTNVVGCDSIITLNLTINHSTFNVINHTACDSYQWFGNILDTSGIYTHTLTNAAGCDSVITLYLTINNSSNITQLYESACVSYTWFGTTYYSTGFYQHVLTNAAGCDSLLNLHLTIYPAYNFYTIANACRVFIWGNYSYTNSGVYYHNFTSVNGCDSNYVLNVTVVHNDTTIRVTDTSLIANINGAQYQWLDCNNANAPVSGATQKEFVPAASGIYAVIITKNNCIDTSACYVFNKIGIVEAMEKKVMVNPNPTTGLLNIALPKVCNDVVINVNDVAGKTIIYEQYRNRQYIQLNVNAENGIYILYINADGNTLLPIKIIKTQ